MSDRIREALEAALRLIRKLGTHPELCDQLSAALRELDEAKPEREELAKWCEAEAATLRGEGTPDQVAWAFADEINNFLRIAEILRGERNE